MSRSPEQTDREYAYPEMKESTKHKIQINKAVALEQMSNCSSYLSNLKSRKKHKPRAQMKSEIPQAIGDFDESKFGTLTDKSINVGSFYDSGFKFRLN